MLTANYLLNRVPSKRSPKSPYELWFKRKPNLHYLKIWGCRAVVKLTDPKRKTLGDKGVECIFIGYAHNSKAYRFLVIEPNHAISVNTVIESRDAIFDETRFTSSQRPRELNQDDIKPATDPLEDEAPPMLAFEKRVTRSRTLADTIAREAIGAGE